MANLLRQTVEVMVPHGLSAEDRVARHGQKGMH
jgi:hypothetical protein